MAKGKTSNGHPAMPAYVYLRNGSVKVEVPKGDYTHLFDELEKKGAEMTQKATHKVAESND